ncbi:hypothetical protein EOL99_02715 [Candidatus Falkowbacteria bacterium]|nr:hypothetical protein [Candidatus Falkowbacteria bacterium]
MDNFNLSKQQKILLVLFELSNGERKNLKFEDISVALFKKFSKDFHMKGYEQYPDSGDSIKRPLYTFRDKGMLSARNMIFALTEKGLDTALKIKNKVTGKKVLENDNFDRYIEKEILRITSLNAFKNFIVGKLDDVFDTDFFDYIGISVRASRMDFKGRLKYINDIIEFLKKQNIDKYELIINFHYFMIKKFDKEINYKMNN